MITTGIIAFREFLEAFLLIGIFIGMDKKFQLGKRKEIILAASCGILFSLLLPVTVFFFASSLRHLLTEKSIDTLEGYLLTFSGFFLTYVVFSLHDFMKNGKKRTITQASEKMKQEIFDLSLFFTIIFFITREGFEVALLIAATALFTVFRTNIEGLIVGFTAALAMGYICSLTYIKLPVKKVFTYTEYLIIIIGAAMVKNGVSLLVDTYFHIHLEKFLSLPLHFLPEDTTIIGHLINNLFGLQKEMGIIQIGLIGVYIMMFWIIFKRRKSYE